MKKYLNVHQNNSEKKPLSQPQNTPEIVITDENLVDHNELSLCEEEKNPLTSPVQSPASLTHVYFRRWIILFIFSFISLLSAFNWIEYNIIQDVTIKFYNASLPEGSFKIFKIK